MKDTTHFEAHMANLSALNVRLSNEKARLATAKNPQEVSLREVWIQQTQKEIMCVNEILGFGRDWSPDHIETDLSDDDLLAELGL